MKNKSEVLENIVHQAMDVLEHKKVSFSEGGIRLKEHPVHFGENAIRKFVSSRLVEVEEDNDCRICFKGEYKYISEFWEIGTESQMKKIVNYVVYHNIS